MNKTIAYITVRYILLILVSHIHEAPEIDHTLDGPTGQPCV